MVPDAVAVAADVDDVAVMPEPVDQGDGHQLVAEDVAPCLGGLIARQHGRGALIAETRERGFQRFHKL